jgi:hypothetical protein
MTGAPTRVREAPAVTGPPARWRVPARPAVAAVWMVAAVLSLWAVSRTGAPVIDVIRYGAYFAGGVTLPGVLLLRAFAPARRTWAEDVGLGSAIGLAYELAGWALWTAAGLRWAQIAWALAVPVVFLAVPRLRQYWRSADPPRLPVAWSAGLAIVVTAAIGYWYGTSVQGVAIPPNGNVYYPDLLWHLSIVHEAGRAVPPQIPQVAGETMHYHWFADAHLASAAQISGIDPRLVVFRLWFAPLLVTIVLCIAALARQVSRAWWTGVAAAAVSVVVTSIDLWNHTSFPSVLPTFFLSPSQTYGSALSVCLAALLIGVLYQSAPAKSWAPVLLLVCASAGAKPTTIPLLLGGTALAALFLLIRNRRLHWPSTVASAGLVVVAALASLTVTGSTAGTAIRLLGAIRQLPGYAIVTGDTTYPGPDEGALVEGLQQPSAQVVQWSALSLVGLLVTMAICVVPLLTLVLRRTRTDPVHWWLLGAITAGWLGFLLVDHPGAAEYYFIGSAAPFGAVSTTALAATGLASRAPRVRRTVLAGCLLVAVTIVGGIRVLGNVAEPPSRDNGEIIDAIGRPLAWLGAIVVLAVAGWFVLRRSRPAVRGLGVTVVAAVALGMVVASRSPGAWKDAAIREQPRTVEMARAPVKDPENEAADWVAHNVPEDDVVATNTLCLLPKKPDQCDARGYLISGIGGRRVFIEGWAYTQQSMAHQHPGVRYTELPSPWPDRVALTDRVIGRPTAAAIADLKARGVRWLVVDGRLSNPDSTGLGKLADRRFDNGLVQIYQLR